MQLIPSTAKRFSVKDLWDPVESIKGGVASLNWLLHFGGVLETTRLYINEHTIKTTSFTHCHCQILGHDLVSLRRQVSLIGMEQRFPAFN
jgi:hypothetical protein